MPYPTIVWSVNGGEFANNAQQTGNVLRILNARPENSGVYVCIATNAAGNDQAATIVEIERKSFFSISIYFKNCTSIQF